MRHFSIGAPFADHHVLHILDLPNACKDSRDEAFGQVWPVWIVQFPIWADALHIFDFQVWKLIDHILINTICEALSGPSLICCFVSDDLGHSQATFGMCHLVELLVGCSPRSLFLRRVFPRSARCLRDVLHGFCKGQASLELCVSRQDCRRLASRIHAFAWGCARSTGKQVCCLRRRA